MRRIGVRGDVTSVPARFRQTFDTSALTEHPRADEVLAFRRSVTGSPAFPGLGWGTAEVVGAAFGYGLIALVLDAMVSGTLAGIAWAISGGAALVWWIGLAVTLAAFGWVFGRWPARRVRLQLLFRGSWIRRTRMHRFARQNRLAYSAKVALPPAFASVLATGSQRIVWDYFFDAHFSVVDVPIENDRNQAAAPYGWAFIRVNLDRHVPHMLLVPTGSRRASRLNPMLRDQVFHLEGDFDRYFTLFVPTGYERDALYVFTPDLMADLIDFVPGSFVELAGNSLTIAFPGTFDLASPETWARVSHVLGSVGRRGHKQTARYAPEYVKGRRGPVLRGVEVRSGIMITAITASLWSASAIVRALVAAHH